MDQSAVILPNFTQRHSLKIRERRSSKTTYKFYYMRYNTGNLIHGYCVRPGQGIKHCEYIVAVGCLKKRQIEMHEVISEGSHWCKRAQSYVPTDHLSNEKGSYKDTRT